MASELQRLRSHGDGRTVSSIRGTRVRSPHSSRSRHNHPSPDTARRRQPLRTCKEGGAGRVPESAAAQRARERRATAGPPWRPPTTAGRRPSSRAASGTRPPAHAQTRSRSRARVDARPGGPQPPPTGCWSMVLRDVASRRSARAPSAEEEEPPPPEIRTRKHRHRKRAMPRSRSPSQKKKKRRKRTHKVKKLVLVSDGNGMWEVKHKRHTRRRQNRETLPDDVTERSRRKSVHSLKNVESATGDWSHCNQMNGDVLLDGEVQPIITPEDTVLQVSNSFSDTEVYERLQPENVHNSTSDCNLMNNIDAYTPASPDDGEADGEVQPIITPGDTVLQVRNSFSDTEVYERLQPDNVHISTSDCNLMDNIDAYTPASPDDSEADPDVIIVEERNGVDPDVIIVEDVDRDADVIIVEEVTNQSLDKDSGADLESNESAPPDARTEFVNMGYSRELVPLDVSERNAETYIGDSDTRGDRLQSERQQWHHPRLPADQWEEQPIRLSPTERDYAAFNQTPPQIPLHQQQQIERQRIFQDLMCNHLPSSPPRPQELVPSIEYRWHQPQAFPEQSQNQNRPHSCQCGSVHETAVDRPALTVEKHTLLQGNRLLLCEEQVEKETRIQNASHFLKTFHGVHSDFEDPTPYETVFREPEVAFPQHFQNPKTRQELSEEYQFQQSYRTVKTEEYQFVKTIFKNSVASQRYVTAQSVAVDRQVIYKEEYKIIPQPQLEWNISDGYTVGDMNLDLNFSRGTLVDVSP